MNDRIAAPEARTETEPVWTDSQKDAIGCRGRTLLVSAAAGSGKTAVLTERLIRRLTDAADPLDLSEILVVTFTKAAAQELQEKIRSALARALHNDPGNARLLEQLGKLNSARISTIHSFCYSVIRSHFELLGLRADARIADEEEADFLRRECISATLDAYYNGELTDIEDIDELVDAFSKKNDSEFEDEMENLYRRVMTYCSGLSFFSEKAALLREAETEVGSGAPFLSTVWGKAIMRGMRNTIESICEAYPAILAELGENEATEKKYLPAFASDYDRFETIAAALRSGDCRRAAQEILSYSPMSLGRITEKDLDGSLNTASIKRIRDYREKVKKTIGHWKSRYFSFTAETTVGELRNAAQICEDVYRFLSAFDARYAELKKKRGILDFQDLERMTLCLLTDGEERSAVAAEISAGLKEIYIDEYQDVNELQDRIFRAIAKPDNRFMVGDIKQSIYSFRGADPSLFAGYRTRFPIYREGDGALSSTIFLPDNFRCDKPIIEVTNCVFDVLFRNGNGSVPYSAEDALVFGRKNGAADPPPVTVALVNGEDCADPLEAEARYVAQEIGRLVARGYHYSDIAVLVRRKKELAFLERALHEECVAYYNTDAGSFFENTDVQFMICLLNVIDNPTRDVYFAGALRSTVFGFTLDELAMIRTEYAEGSLYEAFCAYTEAHAWEKGSAFLHRLGEYRDYARARSVDRLIWYLLCETGILTLADRDSEGGRANLMLLYEYARRFEGGSFGGLYPFLCYIGDLIAEGKELKTASDAAENSDCVKLMTFHHSKGLQFPVCFVFGTGKSVNSSETKNAQFLFHRELGLGIKQRKKGSYGRYASLLHTAVREQLQRENVDEQLCALYVAMTRAQDRLYLTGSRKGEDVLNALCNACAVEGVNPQLLSADRASFLRWILLALSEQPSPYASVISVGWRRDAAANDACPVTEAVFAARPIFSGALAAAGEQEDTVPPVQKEEYENALAALRQRISFVYRYEALGAVPAKLSVSRLYPGILDDAAEEIPALDDRAQLARRRPAFLEPTESSATAADRGIATHAFLQFCDFSRLRGEGAVERELARLTDLRFLSPETGALVSCDTLRAFTQSDLFAEIGRASQVWREQRFTIRLPADRFAQRESLREVLLGETILVQGVIDCLWLTQDGQLRLVDYKTDSFAPETPRETIRDTLRRRHARQLTYYYHACRSILRRFPDRMEVYSFALGESVEIEPLFTLP